MKTQKQKSEEKTDIITTIIFAILIILLMLLAVKTTTQKVEAEEIIIEETHLTVVLLKKPPVKKVVKKHKTAYDKKLYVKKSKVYSEKENITLIKKYFPNDKMALRVFKIESNHDNMIGSYCDKTPKGYSYSWGLAQINLKYHRIGGLNCPSAFKNGEVINKNLYNNCVKKAQDPNINLKKAKEIFKYRGWNSWGAYTGVIKRTPTIKGNV